LATTISVESTPGGGAYVDLTAYLIRSTVSLKVNTLDFTLNNPPAASTQLGAAVKTTDPAWTGTVASFMSSDPVDLRNGVQWVAVTATNTAVLVPNTAPFNLSDQPTTTPLDVYLLEDGSGPYELESGTDFAPGNYELEGALSYAYYGLSVRSSVNSTAGGPPQTLGRLTTQQPGLGPGDIFNLTSFNQGYSAVPFEINQVTVTWPGPVNPEYVVEFGDSPQTLADWAANNPVTQAAADVVQTSPPLLFPSGTVIFGRCSASTGLKTMGGGIVTVATATFTVNPDAGHSLTCQVQGAIDARMDAWDNFIAAPRRAVRALLSGGIYTGAWQELPFGLTRATYDLSSASGISLAAGTYTVSIQIDTQEYNQMRVYGGWAQVAVIQN
jgi:hypothetical protein